MSAPKPVRGRTSATTSKLAFLKELPGKLRLPKLSNLFFPADCYLGTVKGEGSAKGGVERQAVRFSPSADPFMATMRFSLKMPHPGLTLAALRRTDVVEATHQPTQKPSKPKPTAPESSSRTKGPRPGVVRMNFARATVRDGKLVYTQVSGGPKVPAELQAPADPSDRESLISRIELHTVALQRMIQRGAQNGEEHPDLRSFFGEARRLLSKQSQHQEQFGDSSELTTAYEQLRFTIDLIKTYYFWLT